jgi:hypothetical protein
MQGDIGAQFGQAERHTSANAGSCTCDEELAPCAHQIRVRHVS